MFSDNCCITLDKTSKADCKIILPWISTDSDYGDYVVPDVLSPRDLVSGPVNMDETVLSSITVSGGGVTFYISSTGMCGHYRYTFQLRHYMIRSVFQHKII